MLKTDLAIRQEPFKYQHLPEHDLKTVNRDGKRYYDVDGDLFPSVTTVLSSLPKPGLDAWKQKVGHAEATRIMTEAATRGTKAHKMWEEYLRNDVDYAKGMMPTSIMLFKQLQPWLDRNIDFLYGNEIALFSKALRTAGRCDAIASVNGRPAIVDFKTSTNPKKEEWIETYFYQVTAYAIMVEEMYGMVVEDAYILIAVADGSPQSFPIRTRHYKEKVKGIFNNYITNS